MINYVEIAKKIEFFKLRGYSQVDYPETEPLGFSRGKYFHVRHGGLKKAITFQLSSMNEAELKSDILAYYQTTDSTNFTMKTAGGVSRADLLV